jgi:antitoxin component of RelBE/YafQ-DinJ toxin-antitoxin module
MARTERLNIRISSELKEKIKKIAESKGLTVSELIVDYIKSLASS